MAKGKKKTLQRGDGIRKRLKKSPKETRESSSKPPATGTDVRELPGNDRLHEQTTVTTDLPAAEEPGSGAQHFPIVGIGASAGGVEAFTELLHHLPVDTGMGFVFVQHLSPVHESVLKEILARTTRMPVTEIQAPIPVQPNHVYVIPPNAHLSILHGVLHLLPRDGEQRGQYMPIDYFFHALASDLSSRAIGVVLSGTASDGTLGLKAIKAEGGITFAQDEKSSKYDGMPRSAAAAGHVDFVLPPDKIAAELARLGHHPYAHDSHRETGHEAHSEDEDDFQKMLILLRSATGVDFALYKQSTVRRRVLRRMLLQRIDKPREYVRFLQAHPAEVTNLYNDVLINVTGFFRDPEIFDALRQIVFPKIFDRRANQTPVRIWVPGCSTGEEAYSLAMVMLEYLGDRAERIPLQIFATDISELALEKARAGLYPPTIAADVSPDRLQRFFIKLEQGYQVRKSIRDFCIFAKQNLYKDPPFSRLDLITCRNVLIYFGAALHKKVIPMFHYALNPNGFLVLGTSETVGNYPHLFSLLGKKFKFYTKKPSTQPQEINITTSAEHPMKEVKAEDKTLHARDWKAFDFQKEVDRTLLNRYAPAGVVIDGDMEIVQFRGRTGLYLEPASGEASLNILKMAREGLLFDLRGAIMKVKQEGKSVRRDGLMVKENSHVHIVSIEVIPLRNKEVAEPYYLVLFERSQTSGDSKGGKREKKGAKEKKGGSPRGGVTDTHDVVRLKQELAATKEYLQSIIEEQEGTNEDLRSANEEIQSSNEELQSTNEELETAKEELQSANEELNTVNEALENRNTELNQVNDDLMNLLSSVQIPIIMLGNDLRIRRFTPSAERVLNVISTDVGRRITDIRSNVVLPDLEQIIVDVIENLRTIEREVVDNNGYWFTMRVRPYKTADNKIDGVVLVFFDINELKRLDDQRKLLNELGNGLMEVVDDPVVIVDASLRITKVNPAFMHVFNVPRERIEEKSFFELHDHAWRTPEVQDFLGRALNGAEDLGECVVQVDIPGIGPRKYTLMTRPITHAQGHADMILLVIKAEKE